MKFRLLLFASIFLLTLIFCIAYVHRSTTNINTKTLFQTISPDSSGVHFANEITTSDSLDIFTFEYIYNGGGVGIGDFNNDGLQDVFFTGNMEPSKLYLNKGNFKFMDITESSGVNI